jgi:hypothetical protein
MGSDQSLMSKTGEQVSRFSCDIETGSCRKAITGDRTTYGSIRECQAICSPPSDFKWYFVLFLILVFTTVIIMSIKGKFKKG